MIGKDTLWKGIIEDLVEEFIRYFFPDVVGQINFGKGFSFFDKELARLSPLSEANSRQADKLICAWLKNGQEQWFLIHVEVQGYGDPEFAKRMFQSAYRIMDRFQRPVVALVIYTDTNRRYHFTEYLESFFGMEIYYQFRAFVLMDFGPGELLKDDNIFGLALEAAREELERNKKTDQERLISKIGLVRYLTKHEVAREKVRRLLTFIKFYSLFEEKEFLGKFDREVHSLVKSRKNMGIIEAVMEELKTKAKEEGHAEGHAEGRAEGVEEGFEIKERIVVIRAWEKGMAVEDIAFLADIPVEKVKAIIGDISGGPGADPS